MIELNKLYSFLLLSLFLSYRNSCETLAELVKAVKIPSFWLVFLQHFSYLQNCTSLHFSNLIESQSMFFYFFSDAGFNQFDSAAFLAACVHSD